MSYEDCIDVVQEWVGEQGFLTTSFVDRGDPAAYDWDEGTLIIGGGWHDLDLNAIVPATAKAVLLRVLVEKNAVGHNFYFRTKGNVNDKNIAAIRTYVANIAVFEDLVVHPNANGIIQYSLSAFPWTHAKITIGGWWL